MVLICLMLVLSPVSAGFGGNGQGGGGHGGHKHGHVGTNDKDEQNEADGSEDGFDQNLLPKEEEIELWGPDFEIEFDITINALPVYNFTVFQFTWSTYDAYDYGKWPQKCIPCLRLEENSLQMKFIS